MSFISFTAEEVATAPRLEPSLEGLFLSANVKPQIVDAFRVQEATSVNLMVALDSTEEGFMKTCTQAFGIDTETGEFHSQKIVSKRYSLTSVGIAPRGGAPKKPLRERDQNPPEQLGLHLDSTLTVQTKRRYMSSMPANTEALRTKYEVLTNFWLLTQSRQPGRKMYTDFTENTWPQFLKELLNEDNFAKEKCGPPVPRLTACSTSTNSGKKH